MKNALWTISREKLLARVGVDEAYLDDLINRRIPGDPERGHGLTPREFEVFELMGCAVKNRTIAERFGISTKTLDIHRANIQRKLGCKSAGVVRAWFLFTLFANATLQQRKAAQ